MISKKGWPILFLLAILLLSGCVKPFEEVPPRVFTTPEISTELGVLHSTPTDAFSATRDPDLPLYTPTPDSPHAVPTMNTEPFDYAIQQGDTLGSLAEKYGVALDSIIAANPDIDPNWLNIGQTIKIPMPEATTTGPDFKIIPDSELVYGPASIGFNIDDFVQRQGGYLSTYSEEAYGSTTSGAQIVLLVAREQSINPLLLLTVLEYQSGWVTKAHPDENTLTYPMRYEEENHKGLYYQLAWAANQLNMGYYLWKVNGIANWVLQDESRIPVSATINAGTAAIQYLMSQLYDTEGWQNAITNYGVFATYMQFFGYPFDRAVENLVPTDLTQPAMQLPFQPGVLWYFTGGPHGGWADGSAWAALDFAPDNSSGCSASPEYVTAVADGIIVRSANGSVIEDLDMDGNEQTGWVVLYLHIDSWERVAAGTVVRAGDPIGHPSCEGGYASGAHLHIARRYNGEWISADGSLPFNLDGWVSAGTGEIYNGTLSRNGQVVTAFDRRYPENQISR